MTSALAASSQSTSNPNTSCIEENHPSSCDDGLAAFLRVRTRLFAIAYRMLGDAAEAEDVVQDVWLRWQTTNRKVVRNCTAFLAATTTRLAINVMQSARARRETHFDSWQHEPADASSDPMLAAERDQALACGVQMLLDKLTPTERAAYILREAFDYAYRDIAAVLRIAEPNARQVVVRARHHIVSRRTTATTPTERERLLEAFVVAAHDGNVAILEGLFAPNVGATPDGFVRAA